MKIENLKQGLIVKNYKELCNILGVDVKSGKSKRLQMQDFERYFEYHKDGNKIIIDSIKSEVGAKMDKKTLGNNNELSKNLRYMILDLASRNKLNEGESIGFSKVQVYKYCGMVNDNFRDAKGHKKQLSQKMSVSELAVEECIEYTDERLSASLRRACSVLTNTNKALGHRFGYNFIIKGEANELDIHYTADINIEDIIREVENKIMKQMKISRYDLIYKYGRWSEFKNTVISTLKEEYPIYFVNLKYYYNAIVFNYMNETVERTKKGFEEAFGLDRETARLNVNKIFSKSLNGTIDRRHKSTIKKIEDGKAEKTEINEYRMSKDYIKEQKKIKNSIIEVEYVQLSFNIDTSIDNDDENIPF